MSKFKTKFSLTKILLSLSVLTLVAIGCLGQVHNAKAANLAACGLLRNTCQSGSVVLNPDSRVFNSLTRCYDWICRFDNEVACSECPSKCGNGQIDSGEECDGNLLNNQTCTSRGYTGGTLSCNASCRFDESRCTSGTLCGNNQIDSGEDCDGSNLNGQTCVSRGYDSGTLGCYSSCSFNESACIYNSLCGNGVREGGERCDGNDFGLPINDINGDGRVDCLDFGYSGGTLSCRDNCYFNLENCQLSTCNNNGIREYGEECDGTSFGETTCSSFGCRGGNLLCGLDCKIIKTGCSECQPLSSTGCQKTVKSPWSTPAKLIKACCGPVKDTFVSDLTIDSDGLCANGKKPSVFNKVYNANHLNVLSKWEWKCGSETCRAYKKAECAAAISSAEDRCDPDIVFESRDAFFAARTANKDRMCDGGWYSTQSTGMCDLNQNSFWFCVGEAPNGVKNDIRCGVGWAPDAKCGSGASTGVVPDDMDCFNNILWNRFMSLSSYKDNDSDNILCEKGSKPYNVSETMAYWESLNVSTKWIPYYQEAWSPLSSSRVPKYFSWQCVPDSPRAGTAVNCRAKIDVGSCKINPKEAKCGLAEKKKYAFPSSGPDRVDLCLSGTSGSISFNRDTKTWSWDCVPQDKKFVTKNCQVSASVFCGPASENRLGYDTIDELKADGACGGTNYRLAVEPISLGSSWQWVCSDRTDSSVSVICKASNKKCGSVNGLVIGENTFNSRQNESGYLCPSGVTASPSAPNLTDGKWNWSCDNVACQATKLSCGSANGNNYIQNTFEVQKDSAGSFLCSKFLSADRLNYQDNLTGSNSPLETKGGWTWDCVGDDGDRVSDCSADRIMCGWANNHKVLKFAVGNSASGWDNQESFSEFCSNNSKKDNLSIANNAASWTCADPNNPTQSENCSASLVSCGSANNYEDTATDKYYYKETLDNHLAKNDNFLCTAKPSLSTTIDGSEQNYFKWDCGDDFNFTKTCKTNVIYQGNGCFQDYTSKDEFASWYNRDPQFLCVTGNSHGFGKSPNVNNRNPLTWTWTDRTDNKDEVRWYCTDSDGKIPSVGTLDYSLHPMNCYAKCSSCN